MLRYFVISCLLASACTPKPVKTTKKISKPTRIIPELIDTCQLAEMLCQSGLINLQDLSEHIKVDLRYSTTENFLSQDMYGCLDSAYLQPKAALMLYNAQKDLTQLDSTLHLLIWDAVRPRSVQWKMWKALDMPFDQKKRFVSNPRNGSIHNFGCAVDLTICTTDMQPLDMGTDFDHFGPEASSRGEWTLIVDGLLTREQLKNRQLLRKVMTAQGFRTISSEWWHFNAMSRTQARAKYAIVE